LHGLRTAIEPRSLESSSLEDKTRFRFALLENLFRDMDGIADPYRDVALSAYQPSPKKSFNGQSRTVHRLASGEASCIDYLLLRWTESGKSGWETQHPLKF
jgi:hypothetical protein